MPHPARAALIALATLASTRLPAQTTTFSGSVAYEKVPATRTGLRPAERVRTAAAGVKVEVVASPGREVLGAGFTDAAGAFAIPVALRRPGRVYLRALAETENARVVRVSDRAPLDVRSAILPAEPGRALTADLLATDSTRLAGAFNIAVAIGRANALIRAAQPAVALPRVEVRWDTLYVGGTHFDADDGVAFINGRRNRDSDEFDDHVILHEYAHFLMATLSREDSPGGDHAVGERLDPRLAWSEGWADFFSAAVTGDPRYIDTGVVKGRQTVLIETDLELDVHPRERPGIWSEHSVGSALWDWYDEAVEDADSASFGFAPMWAAFVGALREEPDAYLMDFVEALARGGADARALARVLAGRGIAYPATEHLFPARIPSGVTVTGTVDSRSARRSNLWESSAHYWFRVGEPRTVNARMKITAARDPRRADLDLVLFDAKGEVVARSDETNGVGDGEAISRRLQPGYYRIEVRSWSAPEGSRLGDRNANEGSFRLIVSY